MKRLPVYLLLDCSGSMSREMETVTESVSGLIGRLNGNHNIWISTLTFSDTVDRIHELQPVGEVEAPRLEARGGTQLGLALKTLNDLMDQEVTNHDEWLQPEVIVMTDGHSDDEWRPYGQAIRERVGHVVGVAVGQGADTESLRTFSSEVVEIDHRSPENITAAFEWMGEVVLLASEGGGGGLPAPPGFFRVTEGQKPDLPADSPWLTTMTSPRDKAASGPTEADPEKQHSEEERLSDLWLTKRRVKGVEVHGLVDDADVFSRITEQTEEELKAAQLETGTRTDWKNICNRVAIGLIALSMHAEEKEQAVFMSRLKQAVGDVSRTDCIPDEYRQELTNIADELNATGREFLAIEPVSDPEPAQSWVEHSRNLGMRVLNIFTYMESYLSRQEQFVSAAIDSLVVDPRSAGLTLARADRLYLSHPRVARRIWLHVIRASSLAGARDKGARPWPASSLPSTCHRKARC